MIRLDSLDLELDTEPLPSAAVARMRQTVTTTPDGQTRTAYTAGRDQLEPFPGLNGVRVTPFAVGLRLDAKIRGDGYGSGISRVTLAEVCEAINRAGFVAVTPDDLRRATVRRADPFLDVPTADAGELADALRLVASTSGPGVRPMGRGNALTLYADLPNGLGKLRAYNKGAQLSRASHRAFREAHPAAFDALRGSFRFELEGKSRRTFRHVAGLSRGVPTLADVLDSARTPVADSLDGVLDRWEARTRSPSPLPSLPYTLADFLDAPDSSFQGDAFRVLAALVCDLCGGDYDAGCAVLRARYGPKHWYRYASHLRAACEARAVALARQLDAEAGPDRPPVAPASRTLRTVAARLRSLEAA